jgi:hypothetical protein
MGPLTRKRTVEETHYIGIQELKGKLDDRTLTYSWEGSERRQSISVMTKQDYVIFASQQYVGGLVNVNGCIQQRIKTVIL